MRLVRGLERSFAGEASADNCRRRVYFPFLTLLLLQSYVLRPDFRAPLSPLHSPPAHGLCPARASPAATPSRVLPPGVA